MFTEQLTKFPLRTRSPNFKLQKQTRQPQSQDLHFEICTAFLKKTGEKLLMKQADIINQSSQILASIKQTLKNSKRQTLYSSTDDSSETPEDEFSYDSKQQMITRRNISRRSENSIQEALKEVQEFCGPSAYAALSNVVSELSKLQNRLHNIEAKQHVINKKQEAAEKFHQENILLKKRLQDEQNKSSKLEEEIAVLKGKNQIISKHVQQKLSVIAMNQKVVEINQKVYRDVKAFLQDKEMHVNSRLRKIEHMEQSIMVKIETLLYEQSLSTSASVYHNSSLQPSPATTTQPLSNADQSSSPCSRCCMLLKKLKDSILQYRNYLEHEAEEVEKLYSKHKKALFIPTNKGGGSNKSLG